MKKLMSIILLTTMFICPISQGNIAKAEDNSNIPAVYLSRTGAAKGIAGHISSILGAGTVILGNELMEKMKGNINTPAVSAISDNSVFIKAEHLIWEVRKANRSVKPMKFYIK